MIVLTSSLLTYTLWMTEEENRRKEKKRGSCCGENYLPLLLCENVTPIFFSA